MIPCPAPERLRELLGDALGPNEKKRIETHLITCSACQQELGRVTADRELERWQNLLNEAGSGPDQSPSAEFLQRLEAANPLASAGAPCPSVDGSDANAMRFGPATLQGPLGQVGPYHIQAELGHGGMGIVFRAWDSRFERSVALKVLKPPLAALDSFRKRFQSEGKKAATVKHDHLVAIYDAGTVTGSGLPYLVMEYVDGETLAQRLRRQSQKPLDLKEAAAIVQQVALGLSALHGKTLIHRDVKPGNIILERETGRAKITDFGLAHAVNGDSQSVNGDRATAGTPAYISPEQLLPPYEADARSDLFSLGVVLYELLTGEQPFRGTTSLAVYQQVVHDDPLPPRKLNDCVPRDLETICLKCLEKEAQTRYATAGELADDVQRFLAGEPIQARPVGWVERAWRWCRRRPAVASLLALVMSLVVLIAVGATVAAFHFAAASREAELARRDAADKARAETEAKDRAEQAFQETLAAVDRYFTQVSGSEDLRAHGLDDLRRKLLQEAQQFYQHFIEDRGDDVRLRVELARAYGRLAKITSEIDSSAKAIPLYLRGAQLYEELAQQQSTLSKSARARAELLLDLGTLYRHTAQVKDAEIALLKGQEVCLQLSKDHAGDPEYRQLLARTYHDLGWVYHAARRWDDAKASAEKSLLLCTELVRDVPANITFQVGLAATYFSLATFWRLEPGGKSEAYFRNALEIQEKLAQEQPRNEEFQKNLAATYVNLGHLLFQNLRQMGRAEATYPRALALYQKLAGEHPLVHAYQHSVARIQGSLGSVYFETSRSAKAEQQFRNARTIEEQLARDNPNVIEYVRDLAVTYGGLADLRAAAKDTAGQLDFLGRSIQTLENCFKLNEDDRLTRHFLVNQHRQRAGVLAGLRRYAEAIADWDHVVQYGGDLSELREQLLCALCRAHVGQHARATSEAEALTKSQRFNDEMWYRLAAIYAVSTGEVRKDATLIPEVQAKLANSYSTRAMDLLTKTRQNGFFGKESAVEVLRKDSDFDSLRDRADFKALLSGSIENAIR